MRIAATLSAVCLAACISDAVDPATDPNGDGGKADGTGQSHELAGFDETLLAGDSDGKLAVVHVGETFSRKSVSLRTTRPPNVIRSRGGKFYALLESGKLAVIDAKTAKVEASIQVGSSPADFEWADASTIYVSRASTGLVARVELATGTERGTIDLASLRLAGGSVQPRRLLRLDDRLFVQVARTTTSGRPDRGALAVIDTTRDVVEKVIELDGVNPDFDLVHDPIRKHLYVTCAGVRPSNTGVLVRIDTETLAIHDRIPASSGWQGIVQFGDPFETLFMLYHTSTPTTSSHLFAYSVDADGALEGFGTGTLVDAFDGIDALSINAGGTLVAMANHCAVGFCIGGAGLNFVDATSRQVLPKLLADQLGFEPMIVQFAR